MDFWEQIDEILDDLETAEETHQIANNQNVKQEAAKIPEATKKEVDCKEQSNGNKKEISEIAKSL